MKLLLHICCGPCALYPVAQLRKNGISVTGFFYNPNIHPYREFKQRIQTVEQVAHTTTTKIIIDRSYGLTGFLRQVVFHEQERCPICYEMRLESTAQQAKEHGNDAFSTTLLYSKYQNHERIRALCEKIASKYKINFYYQDFREGWQQGIDQAIALNLYRQPYCGCIYSEQERYDKTVKKKSQKTIHS